jgi:hypothetical protein
MQVSHSQGLANQAGPKSCARQSNPPGEALTGERTGRVLSRERRKLRSADGLGNPGRPHRTHRQREMGAGSARSKTPHMSGNALHGNRESQGVPAAAEPAAGRGGKSEDTRRR